MAVDKVTARMLLALVQSCLVLRLSALFELLRQLVVRGFELIIRSAVLGSCGSRA
jgi:hypothetical protein